MANLVIIKCVDCGWPRETAKKNTKYCYACRLERNLAYIGDRIFKCIDCEVRRNQVIRNEELCKVCDEFSTPEHIVGTCGICDREDQRLLGSSIRVCVECIHDPGKRQMIRRELKRRRVAVLDGRIPMPEEPETLPMPQAAKVHRTPEEKDRLIAEENAEILDKHEGNIIAI